MFYRPVLIIFLLITGLFVQDSWAKCEITVAKDGTGTAKTIGEAVDKVPDKNKERCVIKIKPGIYDEQIVVPASKPFISFIGDDANTTKITFNISNKQAGSTSAAFAVYIGGHDFYAENITFENSFGKGSQAVAVLVEADRSVFNKCRFLGWQDTLYAKNGRQYYKDCYIEGHVDYIFGQAAAVFENCHIHSKADGYITAPMRFAADESAGFVFNKCRLTSSDTDKGVYLGRPWRDHGRTVFIDTQMDAAIRPEGWHHWQPQREQTAFFAELRSKGSGANEAARVKWAKALDEKAAQAFSTANFLKGKDGWDPETANDAWLIKTEPDWKLLTWADVFKQNSDWFQTDEAARIGDQLLLYQKANGGFEKNIDMALMLTHAEKQKLAETKSVIKETTIDNRTTYRQAEYLGRLITESLKKASPPNNLPKYKEAFFAAFDYLLASQYDNGGFPQFFPLKKGYYTHITYNDDAMIGVLSFLRDVAEGGADYKFVDVDRIAKAASAVAKGTKLTLELQVKVNGKLTIWAAQYDEKTLVPAKARAFEPISLSGGESVNIVRYLMEIKEPTKEVIDAIEAAIEWYRANEITGHRVDRKMSPEGWKYSLIKDVDGVPLWGRFYEISTMRPIFLGRDGIIKYDLSEIEAERAGGYAWYVSNPHSLLEKEYPKWKKRIGKK